jgi:hypothetical protein
MYYKFPDGNRGIYRGEGIGRELYDFNEPISNTEDNSEFEDSFLMQNLFE